MSLTSKSDRARPQHHITASISLPTLDIYMESNNGHLTRQNAQDGPPYLKGTRWSCSHPQRTANGYRLWRDSWDRKSPYTLLPGAQKIALPVRTWLDKEIEDLTGEAH